MRKHWQSAVRPSPGHWDSHVVSTHDDRPRCFPPQASSDMIIAWRVLEAHTPPGLGLTVVVFHVRFLGRPSMKHQMPEKTVP